MFLPEFYIYIFPILVLLLQYIFYLLTDCEITWGAHIQIMLIVAIFWAASLHMCEESMLAS